MANKGITKSIQFSGLRGQAIALEPRDIPSNAEVRAVIPKRCLSRKTSKSLFYLVQSLAIQSIIVLIGLAIPLTAAMAPAWFIYDLISGTCAMGFWVLAHECGHGAFSDNRKLQTIIGYVLHSFLLVPYFSWQRSHAIHHRFTNHISKGETHVPLVVGGNNISENEGGDNELAIAKTIGSNNFGVLQLILHLVFGWPAYLLAGKTGGPQYGTSNHFWPTKPFSNKLWTSIWTKRVWISDFGVLIMLLFLIQWGNKFGWWQVMALYVGPLLVVNIWLVVYTWLHHTDTDVPHLADSDFSFMRGAFLSVDRPYGRVLDFLHHRIGSTHVIHHIIPGVPHYHAKEATLAIKASFPKAYLYNPTPILKALWHVARNCIAVKREEKSGRYLWVSQTS